MTWFINQSLLFIIVAFLLGLLVGYLWWGRQVRRIRSEETTTTPATPQPLVAAAPAEPVAESAAEPAPVADAEPVAESAPVADPEPAAEPIAEPVAEPEPEPVALAKSEPVAEADPEPEPVAASAAEPLPAEPAAADPVVEDPAPVAVEETEPAAEVEPEPAAESETTPDPEPVAAAETPAVDNPVVVDDELVAEVESAFAAVPVLGDEPEAAEAPKAEDDLARIEGIGPKIAAALKAAGITTYAELAGAERSALEDALANANLRFAPSIGSWSRQARLLADGDEAGFKELTDYLIAGREPTPKKPVVAPDPVAAVEPVQEPQPEPEPEPVAGIAPEPEPEPVVAPEPEPVVAPEPEPVVAPEPEPVVEAEPEPVVAAVVVDDGPPDDLQRIEGIGPKMSAALLAAGIRTYVKLAESDVDTLRTAIEAADLRFAPSIVTWARQARLLADGKEEEFKELTDWLIAGREPTAKPPLGGTAETAAGSDAGSA
ncbi:helix-hairpin-helix domain-containing protein [Dactylosporangium sp. NPDC006015]|uniref:helix-hairpin-helix domain-containing protein n=1 Tax=Dactylosporangium sp. NPDC006015 TaxID=3154576 RepID=UPI0033BB21E3